MTKYIKFFNDRKTVQVEGQLHDSGDGLRHGEYKEYSFNGNLIWHVFYCNNDVVEEIRNRNITDEERVFLSLKHGVPLL